MSTDVPFTPPRKKPTILWWIGGGFLLLFCLFLYQLFGPNPPIVVSKQTTYITAPLKKDGMPDYLAYFLDALSEGVTPENNAATLLFAAIGPIDTDSDQVDALAKALGLDATPTKQTSLRPLYSVPNRKRVAAWFHEQGRLKLPGRTVSDVTIQQVLNMGPLPLSDEAEALTYEVIEAEIDRALSQPWTSNQLPPLAEWIRENQPFLDMIVAASKRPRFYCPPVNDAADTETLILSLTSLWMQSTREAARALSARAMWHLGEGRMVEAWQDVLAIHQLARLQTRHSMLVDQLVAYANSNIASDRTLAVLGAGNLTVEQALQIQRDLESLPDFSLASAFDIGERLYGLESVIRLASSSDFSTVLGTDESTPNGTSLLSAVSIDWNIVLSEVNSLYSEMASAAACPTREQRVAAFEKIESASVEAESNLHLPSAILAAAFNIQRRSKLASGVLLGLFTPTVSAAINAQDRTNAQLNLARIAAALAVYKAKHGSYPDQLNDIARDSRTKLPTDPFSGKSFMYVPVKDGYLIYSVGENGKDELGCNAAWNVFQGVSDQESAFPDPPPDIPQDSDDISFRLPRSPLKPPNP